MMSDDYSLPSRKARICRVAGAVFLVLAALNVTALGAWLIAPEPHIYCDDAGCRLRSEPQTLLDEEDRAVVQASSASQNKFARHVARMDVRLALAGVKTLTTLPFALLIFGMGMALRRLGGAAGNPLGAALPWLRRASIAAILWTLSRLVADSLTATLLAPGTHNDGYLFYLYSDWGEVATALMLAVAAYATVWALEAGLKAQQDLAEIV